MLVRLPFPIGTTVWDICGMDIRENVVSGLEYDKGGKCTYEVRMTALDALEKQIPCKPEEYVPDFPYNIFYTQKCAKCGTPVIGKKISKYCSECGQKIDWGEE